MKIKGAIFDLDGTLLDSMIVWDTLAEDYLRSRGIEPRENLTEKFKNMSLPQAACYYQSVYGLTDTVDAIIAGVNRLIATFYIEKVQAKKGVREFLEILKKRGVKMCVTTAADRNLAQAALKRNQLLPYFESIFTCGEVGHSKDEPVIFFAAQKNLVTPIEHTWVFEDALHAVKTAKAAGFPVVAVYDKAESAPEKMRESADLYIHSFEEMRDLL